MNYSVFVFNGYFVNFEDPNMECISYRNIPAEDAKLIVDVSLRNGMDVVIRQEGYDLDVCKQNLGFLKNLDMAKADLTIIGRMWSAIKDNQDLNTQFQQLSETLKSVDSQTTLDEWRSQFRAFKSEVKAAGKNTPPPNESHS